MKCPFCQSSSRVVDSRKKKGKVARRHKCDKCEKTFPTVEIYLEEYERSINLAPRLATLDALAGSIITEIKTIREDM